jgi:hypothetical protein
VLSKVYAGIVSMVVPDASLSMTEPDHLTDATMWRVEPCAESSWKTRESLTTLKARRRP